MKEPTTFKNLNYPIPFDIFEKNYQWPNELQLRKYYLYREKYALSPAFVKFGKRVLVKPKTFFDIVEGKGPSGGKNDF